MAGGNLTPPPAANPDPIDVCAGVVFRNGLLLIAQRRPEAHLGGLWEFPGGKRDAGETDQDCLKRELLEELGIEVEVGELFETITHAYPEKLIRLKFFLCRWLQHEPRAIGCHAFAWITRQQLANYDFPAADAQLLQKLTATPQLWR
jgi:8-oxo-dGTP diphosphatase